MIRHFTSVGSSLYIYTTTYFQKYPVEFWGLASGIAYTLLEWLWNIAHLCPLQVSLFLMAKYANETLDEAYLSRSDLFYFGSKSCLNLNFFFFSGEGPLIINGSISSATHIHLCSGSGSCGILCHYIGSWRSKGNVLCL